MGLRTVKCVLVLKKHDMFDVATMAEGVVRFGLHALTAKQQTIGYTHAHTHAMIESGVGNLSNAVHIHGMLHANLFKLLYAYSQ